MLKNKHQFTETDSIDLGDMFAIPMERRLVISKDLDGMSAKIGEGTANLRQIITYIENIVDTQEEFLFAYTLHLHYMLKYGRYTFSGDKNMADWFTFSPTKKGLRPFQ